ncbi:hypothetical protein SCP_0309420 [Sparassis crispa]|uniref:Uncharacterized protein n=1 Tax=Sparassis crispa TaxID=139825 RepID=A0A401GGF8_9APHY|nr:hypothetical protein SCP_0309420 [Sparassis crispa]GBE81215.1 hypothetical protein SCP_0309420 [Sparassis crispa]
MSSSSTDTSPPSVSGLPPGYSSSRVHPRCPTCTCPRPPPAYSSPEDADHEWVSTAYKQIRIRFLDYTFASDHQCTELHFPLDGDGVLDYGVLAQTLGVKEVMRQEPTFKDLVLTPLREPAAVIRAAIRSCGYLRVVEFSRQERFSYKYGCSISPSNVRVRWYPSPTTDMTLFEEMLEEIDTHDCLSLGSIARKHNILNVQVFDPCKMKQVRTKFRHVLHPRERSRAMGRRGFIAITDAIVPFPVISISDAQVDREVGSAVRDRTGRIMDNYLLTSFDVY